MIASPTTDRGRATVHRVLEAACVLFARRGVRSTTLDEIGAAAGVGRSQLYHFFTDKTDLVTDVVALQVERLIASMQLSLDAMSTAADVRSWCEELVAYHVYTEGPIRCPIGSLVYELDENAAARTLLQTGFSRWEGLLAESLRRVASSGGLTAGADPAVLATGLLAAYQGGMLLADVSGDVVQLQRALEAVVVAVLAPAEPESAASRRPRRTPPMPARS